MIRPNSNNESPGHWWNWRKGINFSSGYWPFKNSFETSVMEELYIAYSSLVSHKDSTHSSRNEFPVVLTTLQNQEYPCSVSLVVYKWEGEENRKINMESSLILWPINWIHVLKLKAFKTFCFSYTNSIHKGQGVFLATIYILSLFLSLHLFIHFIKNI